MNIILPLGIAVTQAHSHDPEVLVDDAGRGRYVALGEVIALVAAQAADVAALRDRAEHFDDIAELLFDEAEHDPADVPARLRQYMNERDRLAAENAQLREERDWAVATCKAATEAQDAVAVVLQGNPVPRLEALNPNSEWTIAQAVAGIMTERKGLAAENAQLRAEVDECLQLAGGSEGVGPSTLRELASSECTARLALREITAERDAAIRERDAAMDAALRWAAEQVRTFAADCDVNGVLRQLADLIAAGPQVGEEEE